MVDVSLIVPVYNVEKYICDGVDSMLKQTHRNIEIILVDDGSTDRSGVICDAYGKKDARVNVIHQKNGGTGSARNTGMDAAQGEYLYFCDPDDILLPRLVEELLTLARRHHADIVVFGFEALNEAKNDGAREIHLPRLEGCYTYRAFWDVFNEECTFMTSLWTRFFKREYIVKSGVRSRDMSTGQDAVFMYELYAAPFKKIVYCRKAYYTYRIRRESATSVYKPERGENELEIARRFEKTVRACGLAQGRYDDLIARRYVLAANRAVKHIVHHGAFTLKETLWMASDLLGREAFEQAYKGARMSMYPGLKKMRLWFLKRGWYRIFTMSVYLMKKDG